MKAKKITAVCTAALILTAVSDISPFFSQLRINASAEKTVTEPAAESAPDEDNEINSNELELVWNKDIYDILGIDPDGEYAEIPEKATIDGIEYTIVGIKNDFFRNMPNLKSVRLPSTLKTIGDSAFINCTELIEIEIPEGVTEIGENAFCKCESLKTVKLPDSLTIIETAAFEDCTSLKSIKIPNNVTTIKAFTFYNCISLSYVTLPDKLTALEDSVFGRCFMINKLVLPDALRSIHKYAFIKTTTSVEYNWPAEVKEIPSDFFKGLTIEKITIPEGVEKIDDGALKYCCMDELVLPDSIKYIGKEAFLGSGFKSVTIPDSITEIKEGTFKNCLSLKTVNLPDGITAIGDNAFLDCQSLSTVNFPEGLERIGESAFDGCRHLETIKLPESLKEIGENAFFYSYIKELILPDTMTEFDTLPFPCSTVRKLVIPDGLKEIEFDEKNECHIKVICGSENSIASDWASEHEIIYLPPEAPDINLFDFSDSEEGYLFEADCFGDVVIPSTYTYKDKEYPVRYIWTTAFLNMTDVTSVLIPDTVIGIGNEAFYNCTNLRSVSIPNSVKELGREIFIYCELDELTIKAADIELEDALESCTIKKIYGYSSSTAEEYAKKHNIEFEAIGKDKSQSEVGAAAAAGDANCDRLINLADVVMIMQSIANADKYGIDGIDPSHITRQGTLNADVIGFDGMTNLDALTIQKYKLGLIDSLPYIEEN